MGERKMPGCNSFMVLLCGCGMNAWAEERSTGIDESSIGVRWEMLVNMGR